MTRPAAFLPVLLTASVSTRGMVGAAFADDERERMYVETLRWYLAHLHEDVRFVFAENSGWDLARLRERVAAPAGRVEWIAVDPRRCDIGRGKGYNEILLIDDACDRSAFVREAGAFFKLTGRYPVYNVAEFLAEASDCLLRRGYVYYADLKDHRLYDWLRTGWCGHAGSAAYFATTVANYRANISPHVDELNDVEGRLVEHLLYRYMKPYRRWNSLRRGERGGERMVMRFRTEPVMGGFQGSQMDAISFCAANDSPRAKVQRFVGNCIRRLTPWFWF